jgi:hypothetical protein
MKYVIKADDSFHNENDTIKAMNICKKSPVLHNRKISDEIFHHLFFLKVRKHLS